MRVIAPSPEAADAANEAARDVRFVAVAGEGWIGWGEKSGARGEEEDANRRKLRSKTTGGSNDNDGLVLVAVSGIDDARVPGTGSHQTFRTSENPYWWYRRRDGDSDRPPLAADPTRALDHRAVRLVRRDAYGGIPEGREGIRDPLASTRSARVGAPAGVARGALRWRLNFAEDAEGAESVASRFARACREVASERAARREKNYKKQRNRQRNKLGSAERHIWNAMNDMALVDGNGYR